MPILLMALALIGPAQGARDTSIAVGANVLVSYDGDFSNLETPLAASPLDPDVLIAGATVLPLRGYMHDRVYVSVDRGATWRTSVLPGVEANGSADPMVAVGSTGTLHFVTLDRQRGAVAYRSADGGWTWDGPVEIHELDREYVTVDYTRGRFRGRIYLAGTTSIDSSTPGVQVWYSTDDGRTYRGGGMACADPEGVISSALLTLSDGTLFTSCLFSSGLVSVTSSDGGETFAPPTIIVPRPIIFRISPRAPLYERRRALLWGNQGAVCAADTSTAARRDRIYCAWMYIDTARYVGRIHFAWSANKGVTWSAPKAVDAAVPIWAIQGQPTIAVDREGVVGVAWLDSRASRSGDRYHVHFTASRDGGATFLPSVRVTSAASFPAGAGNRRPSIPQLLDYGKPAQPGARYYQGFAAFTNRRAGGDYIGMVADTAGEFHLVWPDARSGTWQVYAARIRVAPSGSSFAGVRPDSGHLQRAALSDRTVLAFDPTLIDPATYTVTLPVRIRNTSSDTLYGPFAVELVTLAERSDYKPGPAPLNATNGKRTAGARFDYVGKAGTFDLLPPGSVTEPMPWRFQLDDPLLATVQFQAVVRGFRRESATRAP